MTPNFQLAFANTLKPGTAVMCNGSELITQIDFASFKSGYITYMTVLGSKQVDLITTELLVLTEDEITTIETPSLGCVIAAKSDLVLTGDTNDWSALLEERCENDDQVSSLLAFFGVTYIGKLWANYKEYDCAPAWGIGDALAAYSTPNTPAYNHVTTLQNAVDAVERDLSAELAASILREAAYANDLRTFTL